MTKDSMTSSRTAEQETAIAAGLSAALAPDETVAVADPFPDSTTDVSDPLAAPAAGGAEATDADMLVMGDSGGPLNLDAMTVLGLFDGVEVGETEDPGPLTWLRPENVKAVEIAPGGGETTSGGSGDDTIVADPYGPLFEKGSAVPAGYETVIHGGDGNDTLFGGAGDDSLYGEGDDDQLWGGAGNDLLVGGDGRDFLWGEDGDDTLFGNDGNDDLSGGAGEDVLDGGAGFNWLRGGGGADILTGGAEYDFLDGGFGADTLHGGAGNDDLMGYEDADMLFGDAGDDALIGGDGQDEMWGGTGADWFRNAGTDGLYDIVHDYSFDEGDRAFGHHYDVDVDGNTRVYDDQSNVILLLAGYDAYAQGIELSWA